MTYTHTPISFWLRQQQKVATLPLFSLLSLNELVPLRIWNSPLSIKGNVCVHGFYEWDNNSFTNISKYFMINKKKTIYNTTRYALNFSEKKKWDCKLDQIRFELKYAFICIPVHVHGSTQQTPSPLVALCQEWLLSNWSAPCTTIHWVLNRNLRPEARGNFMQIPPIKTPLLRCLWNTWVHTQLLLTQALGTLSSRYK